MKGIKSYLVKITLLLIALGSITMLYWFGYHKNYDERSIPKNADGLVMVDMKNIQNYFVFSYLKNPSQWQSCVTNFGKKKKFNLSRFGIEASDYMAFFHIENQPINQWFVVAKIINETDFEKAMIDSHFIKTKLNTPFIGYYSKALGLFIVRHSDQILCCNASKQQQTAIRVAEDLFLKHQFLDPKKINKTIDNPNAATVWIKKNSLLQNDAVLNLKLADEEIIVEGQLKWKPNFIKTASFSQNPNTLLSFGFNFEMIRNQNSLKRHSVQINKIIGFNLDSILAHNPTKTELLLNEMVVKNDSAISYDYDDDFNPIKKVIVHTSREPSFYFSMQTEDPKKVYLYLKSQKAIDNHEVFVNFPLAPTKFFIKNNSLTLAANLPKQWIAPSFSSKVAYLHLNFNKLQAKDWHYIIAKNKRFQLLQSFKILSIDLTQENNLGHFQGRLKTKNGRSLIEVIK
jgi:hypothetical protein